MIKKIGKYFLIVLFFNIFIAGAVDIPKVSLSITDHNSNNLLHVGAGVPFVLELTLESTGSNLSEPVVKNIDQYFQRLLGTSTTMHNNNGNMIMRKIYQYELVIDSEGSYKLGPVYISGKDSNLFVNVNVQKDQKLIYENTVEALVKVTSNKSQVFLGEPLEITVKFYVNSKVHPLGLQLPEFKDFNLKKADENSSVGNEIVNGNNMSYQEWKFILYPKKIGTLVMPVFKGYFEVVSNITNLFGFFGPQLQRKEALSNSLQIKVDPLPAYNKKINGVGIFKNFKATVNQNRAMQSEGIVYKLDIEGNSDLENLQYAELAIAKGIQYYDSKNHVEPYDKDGFAKKSFEFIVQCSDAGKFQIPAQTFVFFDPSSKKFVTLQSNSIDLIIDPIPNVKDDLIKNDIEGQTNNQTDINPIYTNYSSQGHFEIDFSWFVLFALIPFIIQFIMSLKSYLFNSVKYNDFKLMRMAQKKLLLLKKENDCSKLYELFMTYFSARFDLDRSLITNELIKDKLKKIKLSDDMLIKWDNFFTKITEASFYKSDKFNCKELFDEAQYWLRLLKKS